MQVLILESTGALGRECLSESLEAGHDVAVLVRTAAKLPEEIQSRIHVIEGDALDAENVSTACAGGVEAVLFAIGMDKNSQEGADAPGRGVAVRMLLSAGA